MPPPSDRTNPVPLSLDGRGVRGGQTVRLTRRYHIKCTNKTTPSTRKASFFIYLSDSKTLTQPLFVGEFHAVKSVMNWSMISSVFGWRVIGSKNLGGIVTMSAPAWNDSLMSCM